MIRQALVCFADSEIKHIEFQSFETRIDKPVRDFSSKLIRRTSEKYIYQNYSQNNLLTHKYSKEGEDGFNGNIQVTNKNLGDERILYASKTFAPESELTLYNSNASPTSGATEFYVPKLRMYDLEITQEQDAQGNDVLLGTYKPLKDRFFMMRSFEMRFNVLFIGGDIVTSFPVANFSGMTFDEIVGIAYDELSTILNNTRLHTFELQLTKYESAIFALDRIYYFEQEKAFYLANSFRYQGNKCILEGIKLRPRLGWKPNV